MARRPPLPDEPTRDIGPYRLAHRIAVGGMAEVFRALWPQGAGGDRAVVIKKLLPSLASDPEQRAMFDFEARLGRRIAHPNVVTVLDHGLDGDAPYLVLEYVFGVDLWRLSRWLRRTGQTLSIPAVAYVGAELCAGLAAVHDVRDARGTPLSVVHHDVSPSNIFLSVHGDVKLGDLGIARAALWESAKRGPGSRAKGKLGYLAPEQVTGRPVDQRGDIFAAAIVIAELLLGAPLFAGGTEIGVLLAIRDGDVGAFRALLPSLPQGLGQAVLEALERDPERRTPTAAILRSRLTPFVTDPARARAELGALVVGALDDEGSTHDRTSLAQTIEKNAAWYEMTTPAEVDRSPLPDDPDLRPRFEVLETDGPRGPLTLAELVREVTTGRVAATTPVREGAGEWRPLAAHAELARYLPPSTRTPSARRRTHMAETSETYDLASPGGVLGVIARLLVARENGLLLCEDGELRKEVYLEAGVPVFVTSNVAGELLGEHLVTQGVVDRAELDLALAMMPRFEGRLGETLVALGLVDPVQLVRHIGTSVRDKLVDLCAWRRGHAALYRGVERPERAFPLGLDTWELFERGAALRIARGLDREWLEGDLQPAMLVRADELEELALPPHLELLWSACGAPRSVSELEGMLPDRERARACTLVLLALGALRPQPERGA